MRKAIGFSSLIVFLPLLTNAQQPIAKPAARATAKPAAARAEAASVSSQLPVTRVALYKNGVGFFEHAGRVTGDQSVTIDFTTAQLNDVLQSLTAIDLNGGRIAGAGYNSTTPLDQQLKALPLALGEDPTAIDFYNAIRGARVEVTGSGAAIRGRLLNIENVENPENDGQPTGEKRLLTVVGDAGEVRTVELANATQVRLLDSDLHTDITRYLQLLASTRNQGLRHLTLQDHGTGTRELHVSYISEVPVWKSTYRILFTEPKTATASTPQTATLQGWSVVDNTTGADWINVQLSLIAGAPQSFIQPLSVPYYSRRPEIGLPQEAQLTPQTHESGEDKKGYDAASAQANGVMGGTGMGSGGGFGGGVIKMPRSVNQTVAVAGALPMLETSNATLGGTIENESYQEQALNSLAPNTTTSAFDDYFEYKLAEPITIRKNESALVPILQTKVDAERVTLWSPQRPTPLRALWITNTSNLTLDRGSFSIVEDGNFGGEGLLDPIHPAEKRLLSYAVDQAVRVTTSDRSPDSHITEFIIADGWLRQISSDSRSVEYTVHNAAPEPRTVVIERPLANGWTFAPASAKPEETTSTVNRYKTIAEPGGTAKVHIDETRLRDQNWHLLETDDSQFNIILHNAQPSPQLLAEIQPIVDAKHAVAGLDKDIRTKQTAIDDLIRDQARLRSDLSALKDTPEQRTLASRYTTELTKQEDQLANLRSDVETLKARREAAQQDLNQKIATAKIDVKL